jgi:GTP-binding protein Era
MNQDASGHFGYVGLIGRPNVGKSTLLNHLIGQKLSIVTHKPQTTRQRIAGILTRPEGQIVFLDTPGIHKDDRRAINRYMNRTSMAILGDVDVIVWLVEAAHLTADDEKVLECLKRYKTPVIVAVNKLDQLEDKERLLPFMEKLAERLPGCEPVPMSALKGDGVDTLLSKVTPLLPMSRPLYDEDEITDRSERFIAGELIREQLFLRLHQEIPYAATVQIEDFKREGALVRIHAVIWVERDSQKAIVIGHKGQSLKWIGQQARRELQDMLQCKVHLETWVKTAKSWSDSEQSLSRFGYTDN